LLHEHAKERRKKHELPIRVHQQGEKQTRTRAIEAVIREARLRLPTVRAAHRIIIVVIKLSSDSDHARGFRACEVDRGFRRELCLRTPKSDNTRHVGHHESALMRS